MPAASSCCLTLRLCLKFVWHLFSLIFELIHCASRVFLVKMCFSTCVRFVRCSSAFLMIPALALLSAHLVWWSVCRPIVWRAEYRQLPPQFGADRRELVRVRVPMVLFGCASVFVAVSHVFCCQMTDCGGFCAALVNYSQLPAVRALNRSLFVVHPQRFVCCLHVDAAHALLSVFCLRSDSN